MRQILVLFILLCPLGLEAQEIAVRSGEHGTFTRLVFDMPGGADWSVESTAEGAAISIDPAVGFDTGAAFSRITRERISRLRSEGGVLIAEFACDCIADSFQMDDMLVVDVRQLRDGEERPPAIATAGTMNTSGGPNEVSPLRAGLSEIRVGQMPGIGPEPKRNPFMPMLDIESADVATAAQSRDAGVAATRPNGTKVTDLSADLARQLATAATKGVLTSSAQTIPSPRPDATTRDEITDDIPPGTTDISDALTPLLEELSDVTAREARLRIGANECLSPERLALASWVTQEDPFADLSMRRQELFGEFDRPNPNAIRELSKAYLYLGFGAEAKATERLHPDGPDPVLMGLAEILDGGRAAAGRLVGMTGCDGPAALWSLLGSESLPETAQIDTKAIVRAFEDLPRHLRSSLGPRLVERLAEEGRRDAAREVVVRLERMLGGSNDEISLATARIDALDGAIAEAQSILAELASRQSSVTAEAVVDSLQLVAQTDGTVSGDLVELSGALASEYREQEQGPALWLSHMRALVASSAFETAFDTLSGAQGMPEGIISAAATELFSALAQDADDLSFLKLAILHGNIAAEVPDEEPHYALADRFLDLGFPDEASVALDRGGDRRKDRLLRAEILLAQGEAERAEVALTGVTGEDADGLRAQARAAMGDHDFAKRIFTDLGAGERALDAAWLAGDWQRLADSEGGVLSDTARLVRQEPPSFEAARPTLAGAQSLAEEAALTSGTLRTLLEETRPQPFPDS